MDLKSISHILDKICVSSVLISLFCWFLWIVVYALDKVTLMKVMSYMALLWLIAAFVSGLLAVICYIWSDVFEL